ncbi:5404_t:CDS:1, partial [Cetraspora pellucida]
MYQLINSIFIKLFELFLKYFVDFIKINQRLIENTQQCLLVPFYNHFTTVVTNTRQHLSDISNDHLGEILSFYDIFIKKLNELNSVKTFTDYKYPLNGGTCWNCKRIGYSHSCCVACKQKLEQCDCKFICGLTYPTQYDKYGRPCQFAKCRYFTNDLNKVIHQCKGK